MTLANRITFFRLALIPPFCGLIYACSPERDGLRAAALAVYLMASISDFVDGYLARNWGQATRLGRRIDPMADKMLVNLGFVFMAANESLEYNVPRWFPVLLLTRDASIVGASFFIARAKGRVRVTPSLLGKLCTCFQFLTMIAVLAQWPAAPAFMWATLVLTILSGLGYIRTGWVQATAPGTA